MNNRIAFVYSVVIEKSRIDNTFCCVPQCNSHGGRMPELSFHRFPCDEIKKKHWQIILRIGKEISSRMRVCSLHFKSKDYLPDPPGGRSRKRLKNGAIPSLKLPVEKSSNPLAKKGYPTGRRRLKRNAIPSLCLPTYKKESSLPKTKRTKNGKGKKNSSNESSTEIPLIQTLKEECVICNGHHSSDQCIHVKTEMEASSVSSPKNTQTTIRISNLPEETYHSDLHKIFGSFGNVDKIYVVKTSPNGKCNGLAFVHYTDPDQATKALLVDGFTFGTKVLKVEWAKGMPQNDKDIES